jgi:hypothetical protein
MFDSWRFDHQDLRHAVPTPGKPESGGARRQVEGQEREGQSESDAATKDMEKFWKEMETKYKLEIKTYKAPDPDSINFIPILFVFLIVHVMGVVIMNSPQLITMVRGQYNYSTEISLLYGFIAISGALLIMPVFIRLRAMKRPCLC